jgi:hypothetical protein
VPAGAPRPEAGARVGPRRAQRAVLITYYGLVRQLRAWLTVMSRSPGPVDVTAVPDVDNGDDMGLVADPVDDAVGPASRAEPVL